MTPADGTGDLDEAIVVDASALAALGSGNRIMSRFGVAAHDDRRVRLYAPAMCVAAAVSGRPMLAAHIGGLLVIDVLDLTFATACSVGHLIAEGTDWRQAHAVIAAAPNAEWVEGLPVATATPGLYRAHGIRAIAVA